MLKASFGFVAGLIAGPVLLVLVLLAGWFPSNATSTPPAWEIALGSRALDASLERRASRLTNPIGGSNTAALMRGMKIYRTNCAGCHGGAREASAWGTRGFYPRVPQFWQDPIEINPEEAYVAIHDGIRYSGMAAWRDLISEEEMWEAANFVSRVHNLPPEVIAAARAPAAP